MVRENERNRLVFLLTGGMGDESMVFEMDNPKAISNVPKKSKLNRGEKEEKGARVDFLSGRRAERGRSKQRRVGKSILPSFSQFR